MLVYYNEEYLNMNVKNGPVINATPCSGENANPWRSVFRGKGAEVRNILEKILVLRLYKIISLLKKSYLFTHLGLKVTMVNTLM